MDVLVQVGLVVVDNREELRWLLNLEYGSNFSVSALSMDPQVTEVGIPRGDQSEIGGWGNIEEQTRRPARKIYPPQLLLMLVSYEKFMNSKWTIKSVWGVNEAEWHI